MTFEETVERFENTFGAFALGDDDNDLNAEGNAIIEAIANEGFSDEDVEELIDRFRLRINVWFEMLKTWKDYVGR